MTLPDFILFGVVFAVAFAVLLRRLGISIPILWGQMRWRKKRKKKPRGKFRIMRRKIQSAVAVVFAIVAILHGYETVKNPGHVSEDGITISCHNPYIIDGDTLDCAGERIRLQGIDAPEMPSHCRAGRTCVDGDPYASKAYLKKISKGAVTCTAITTDHYGRTIARCKNDESELDFSCAMIDAGMAAPRYGRIRC